MVCEHNHGAQVRQTARMNACRRTRPGLPQTGDYQPLSQGLHREGVAVYFTPSPSEKGTFLLWANTHCLLIDIKGGSVYILDCPQETRLAGAYSVGRGIKTRHSMKIREYK